MDTIRRLHAREVLDSRGRPTVEAEVEVGEPAVIARAIVPSGASTGRHEAVEKRDRDLPRYRRAGVLGAVRNIREVVAPALEGVIRAGDQQDIDRLLCDLDGTPDKSRLGANAILAVSMACAVAGARARRTPLWRSFSPDCQPRLPLPMVNLISGGLHARGGLDFQDFLLLPVAARTYSESLEIAVRVYRALGGVLGDRGYEGALVGDEGGYGPKLESNEQAIEMCLTAFRRCGLEPGKDAALALDVAASHFYRDGKYHLREGGGVVLDSAGMVDRLVRWCETYPIFSIEDGLAEDDYAGWEMLTQRLGHRIQLIGDDLFCTNPRLLRDGIDRGLANGVLVKLNQIGTVTETLHVVRMARDAGYRAVISARSGETEDTFLADFAVATGAGQIKIGSVARSERLAKYNQLLRIEEEMGPNPPFARWQPIGKGAADAPA